MNWPVTFHALAVTCFVVGFVLVLCAIVAAEDRLRPRAITYAAGATCLSVAGSFLLGLTP